MLATLWVLLTVLPVAAAFAHSVLKLYPASSRKRYSLLDGLCAVALRFLHLCFAIHRSFQAWVQNSLNQADLDVQLLLVDDRFDDLDDRRRQLADFLQSLPQRPENFAVVLPDASHRACSSSQPQSAAALDAALDADLDAVETLCAWALLAKIPRLTVYTRDGRIKRAAACIDGRLQQSKMVHRAFGNKTPRISLNSAEQPSAAADTPPPDLHVALWSRDDGFPALAGLSRKLACQSRDRLLHSKDIDEALVAAHLKDPLGHAHPDLLLLYDDLVCIPEFPPWQMQNTEVFQIGSAAKSLGDAAFHALASYAKIEKRWGK
ncbi:hypothetical protein GGI07_003469 [Coemansia sp. Benny D115]|nr:hypothetical protein GGI07_003469 [Coemansia sp. Benny D115]